MNTPQVRDAQFQQHQHYDDEISLVDLAKTLIKRRNWVIAIFFIGLIGSLTFAWLQQPKPAAKNNQQLYTTLIAVGYKAPNHYLEPLLSIETQLTNAFIPQASANQTYKAEVIVMEDGRNFSNIIKLTTQAEQNLQNEVAAYHQAIIKPLLKRHQTLIEEIKANANKTTEAQTLTSTSIAALAQPLTAATQVKDKTKLILAVGIVLSIMLGVMAAFFAEFAAQVRKSLKEENQAKI